MVMKEHHIKHRIHAILLSVTVCGVLLFLTAWVLPVADFADATFLGASKYDYIGRGLAMVGDANGDGYDDFLLGAYNATGNGTQVGVGVASLVLGRPAADWGTGFDAINQADATFSGEDYLSRTGYSVAGAGDVNGDGYDDFLIGADRYDASSTLTQTGKVYLVLGRAAADWGKGFDLALADASFIGEAAYDYAGYAVSAAGDVNGDGYDDFLVGAFGVDGGGSCSEAGRAYLLLGRQAADWGQNVSLSNADVVFLSENCNDTGYAVAGVGDVNGDSYSDLLIGAHAADDSAVNAGKVYLVLGRATAGWSHDFDLANADASFVGEANGDRAGMALAGAGDVDQDGFADFLIGAPNNDDGGIHAGKTYVILGRQAADWGQNVSLANADASFQGAHSEDYVGSALAGAGDVNRDGYDDFLIGAYLFDSSEVLTNSGRAYLVLGRPSGWQTDTNLGNADTATDIFALDGEAEGDDAGTSLAGGGDVNGDGFADYLVGAPYNDENGDRAGKAYLMLGKGLVLQKFASTDSATPGDRITYTMRYTNTNVWNVQQVRIGDAIPQGTSYAGCVGGITCTRQGPLVYWYLGTVVSRSTGIVRMAVQVSADAPAGAMITNTAWITAPNRVNPVFSKVAIQVEVRYFLYLPTIRK
jgi:uncharacterized repeat protein (TIGR01451 family)